jgi:alpha/beta superfamily hydrolase
VKALPWQPGSVVVAADSVEPTASAGSLRLEARWLGGEAGAAVIAPSHPLYGGTFHNPVVINIADGLQRAGIGALTFNWRGVDGSEGAKTDSLPDAVADYRAALATLRSTLGGGPLYAAGYSFGAATALLAALEEPDVSGLILLAPPAGMLRAQDLAAARGRMLVVVGDDDEFAPLTSLEPKLSGTRDLRLEVIAGADHFFHFGGLDEIAARVAAHVLGWKTQ